MSKYFMKCCLAAGMLGTMALPAAAQALNDPQMTGWGGSVVTPAPIEGRNIGNVSFMQTDGMTSQVTCSSVRLTGSLNKNKESTLEGSITRATFSGTGSINKFPHHEFNECTAAIGNAWITAILPLTIKSTPAMNADEFQVFGFGGGKVKFIIGSTVAGECEYEATQPAITGSYTTAATTVLTVHNTQFGSGFKLIRGGFFCPTSGQLKMSFFLEEDFAPFEEVGIS
jgi:hypothetical protein